MILMLTCLGALISWKKASIGDSLVWCGWRFNFAYETVELCAAKRDKLRLQIQDLLSRSKVPRKDLEACIGLLMWATNISQVLKPYLAPLYRLLTSPPGANFSIAPRMWPAFLHCLVIEWGNKPLHCKTDLPLMSKPTGHTWIRVSDPSCPVIKMTKAAQESLRWLSPRIAAIPTTPLSLPPLLSSLARADAMAEGSQVGIGGWISTNSPRAYTVDEIRSFWPFLTKDAQKYIACFETLAQLALAMRAKAHHGHSCMNICLPAESDNTPTKGGVQQVVYDLLASFRVPRPHSLLELGQRHHAAGIARRRSSQRMGRRLEQGRLQAFAHRPQDRCRVPLKLLASAASEASWTSNHGQPDSPI